MRIVSQDGLYDFPYEAALLTIAPEDIMHIGGTVCVFARVGTTEEIFARYSNETVAVEALRRLHNSYLRVMRQKDRDGIVHYVDSPKVWRFPEEEAVKDG